MRTTPAPFLPLQKYITLFGSKSQSRKTQLAAPGVHFTTGAVDTFVVHAKGLGELEHIKIQNDSNAKPDAWFLDSVCLGEVINSRLLQMHKPLLNVLHPPDSHHPRKGRQQEDVGLSL